MAYPSCLSNNHQVASTSPGMTTVFHASWDERFVKIAQPNLRRKKVDRMNRGSNCLQVSSSNRDNVRTPIHFRKKSNASIFQDNS